MVSRGTPEPKHPSPQGPCRVWVRTPPTRNGKYHFSNAGGYTRSIQPIAQYLGAEVRGNTGIAGRAAVDVSLNKPSINIPELKKFITMMQQGLKDESRAEADFYKNWINPD